jgi:anti-sigma factor RsiW
MSRCEEIAVRLYQYIDRELTPAEYREVQEHLDACPPCKHVFQLERNVLCRWLANVVGASALHRTSSNAFVV